MALALVAGVKVAVAALPRAEEVATRVGVAQKPVAAEAEVPRWVVVAAEQARAVAVAEPLLSAVQLWRLQPGRPAQRVPVAGGVLLPWLVLRQAPHS